MAFIGGTKTNKRWMQHVSSTMHKGGLHRSLGVPEGEKIPPAKIEAATHSSSPKVRKQAVLAQTFAKARH